MKLTHIFWALLILVLLVFIPGLFYRTNTKLGGGPDLLAFFLLLWVITSIISPLILILTKFRIIRSNISFLSTLLAVFNLYFGSYGIYLIMTGQISRPGNYTFLFLILNLVWAVLLILMSAAGVPRNPPK
jgi:hypothetical protein